MTRRKQSAQQTATTSTMNHCDQSFVPSFPIIRSDYFFFPKRNCQLRGLSWPHPSNSVASTLIHHSSSDYAQQEEQLAFFLKLFDNYTWCGWLHCNKHLKTGLLEKQQKAVIIISIFILSERLLFEMKRIRFIVGYLY